MANELKMLLTLFCVAIATPGVVAFILGVFAENWKPVDVPAPVIIDGRAFCFYPKDRSPALGSVSAVLFLVSYVAGLVAVFFPFHGSAVPLWALWRSGALLVLFLVSLVISFTAEGLLLWATVAQSYHRHHNVHNMSLVSCPSAKAGLFGGAAFLALDATLFWLLTLMLTMNARARHLLQGQDEKGSYGQLAVRYTVAPHSSSTV